MLKLLSTVVVTEEPVGRRIAQRWLRVCILRRVQPSFLFLLHLAFLHFFLQLIDFFSKSLHFAEDLRRSGCLKIRERFHEFVEGNGADFTIDTILITGWISIELEFLFKCSSSQEKLRCSVGNAIPDPHHPPSSS